MDGCLRRMDAGRATRRASRIFLREATCPTSKYLHGGAGERIFSPHFAEDRRSFFPRIFDFRLNITILLSTDTSFLLTPLLHGVPLSPRAIFFRPMCIIPFVVKKHNFPARRSTFIGLSHVGRGASLSFSSPGSVRIRRAPTSDLLCEANVSPVREPFVRRP